MGNAPSFFISEYSQRYAAVTLSDSETVRAVTIAKQILANKDRYKLVEARTGVPWIWVACVHYRESDLNFDRHLHNGDPLTHRTIHTPRGRIPGVKPPYTWEQSAEDALRMRNLDKVKDWSFDMACYQWEAYNGWGYRLYHHMPSPYLWAGFGQQPAGKYTSDGHFDPVERDMQLGCAALYRALQSLTVSDPPPAAPTVAPAKPSMFSRARSYVASLFSFGRS